MDKKKIVIISLVIIALILIVMCVCMYLNAEANKSKPEDVFTAYMTYLVNGEYEKMYELLDENSKKNTSQDVFVSRNNNIYSGIEAKNIKITNVIAEKNDNRNSKNNV